MPNGMQEFFEKIDVFRDIVYDDLYHSYTIGGKKTVSVTRVTGSAKPPFDDIKISRGSAVKALRAEGNEAPSEEEINARAERLRADWKLTNLISTEKGTAAHAYMEASMANKFARYPASHILEVFGGEDPVKGKYDGVIRHMDSFKRDIAGKMVPVKSEVVIGSPKYLICGMIDQIFWNVKSQQFELWDWKTNAKFRTESEYRLLDPVAHLSQCELDEYSLQLACYKKIFTGMTGIQLGNSYLCWFCETEPTYRVYKCKELYAEADLLIKKSMTERGIE